MNIFRGRGCLYGCLGAFAAVILTVLGAVAFAVYAVRQSCIEATLPLQQALETCALTTYDGTDTEQSEKIQELLNRLQSLSQPSGNAVTLSADEVQILLNHIISHPLPKPKPEVEGEPPHEALGLFVQSWFPKVITKVSISKDSIALCAVAPVDGSLLSWCPATPGRAGLARATLIPSTARAGQPLTISAARLDDTEISAAILSSFQMGLYGSLADPHKETNSPLLQTLTSKIERITLEEGSLILHPKRASVDSEGVR